MVKKKGGNLFLSSVFFFGARKSIAGWIFRILIHPIDDARRRNLKAKLLRAQRLSSKMNLLTSLASTNPSLRIYSSFPFGHLLPFQPPTTDPHFIPWLHTARTHTHTLTPSTCPYFGCHRRRRCVSVTRKYHGRPRVRLTDSPSLRRLTLSFLLCCVLSVGSVDGCHETGVERQRPCCLLNRHHHHAELDWLLGNKLDIAAKIPASDILLCLVTTDWNNIAQSRLALEKSAYLDYLVVCVCVCYDEGRWCRDQSDDQQFRYFQCNCDDGIVVGERDDAVHMDRMGRLGPISLDTRATSLIRTRSHTSSSSRLARYSLNIGRPLRHRCQLGNSLRLLQVNDWFSIIIIIIECCTCCPVLITSLN